MEFFFMLSTSQYPILASFLVVGLIRMEKSPVLNLPGRTNSYLPSLQTELSLILHSQYERLTFFLFLPLSGIVSVIISPKSGSTKWPKCREGSIRTSTPSRKHPYSWRKVSSPSCVADLLQLPRFQHTVLESAL